MRFAVLYLAASAALFQVIAGHCSNTIAPHGPGAQLPLLLTALYFAAWGVRALVRSWSDRPRLAGWRLWHLFLHALAGGVLVALALGAAGPSLRLAGWGPGFLLGVGLLALTVGLAVLFPSSRRATRPALWARALEASVRAARTGLGALGWGRLPATMAMRPMVKQGSGSSPDLPPAGHIYDRF